MVSPTSEAAELTEQEVRPSSVPLIDEVSASEVWSVEIGDEGYIMDSRAYSWSSSGVCEMQDTNDNVEEEGHVLEAGEWLMGAGET